MAEPILTITDNDHEYHPAEYAAFWGNGSTSGGCLYYNCSEQVCPGAVIANTDWTAAEWAVFAATIRADIERVQNALAEPDAAGTGWTLADVQNLDLLAKWAAARAIGPQRFTYIDGESGAELVRLTEAQVYGCSGSGAQDANVAAALPDVEWLADDDTIKEHLQRYGSWDDKELSDPTSNKERCLWLACCDCSEQPASYAD